MEMARPTDALAGDAGFLLSRVGTAVQAGFKEVLGAWQIRPLHFLILIALSARESASQQELCRALRVDSGNMVELIDTLEKLGYAGRRRDPGDRRRYLVALTGEGRTAHAAMTAAVDRYTRRFMEPLDPAEQTALVAALRKLYVTTGEGQGRPFQLEPATTKAREE
ncbi:MAG: MarR family transcriptional regulator [Streptosporangiaceae bacterium]